MKNNQHFFQKLSGSYPVSIIPYILGFLIAGFLNTVQVISIPATPSGNEPFMVALLISIGVCSFIGIPVTLIMLFTQAIVKRCWKNSAGEKIFKFIRQTNKIFTSIILSTFISSLIFLSMRFIFMLPNSFWQEINPLSVPHNQWRDIHYFFIFFGGIITILLAFLLIILFLQIVEKTQKYLISLIPKMGSNQKILKLTISILEFLSNFSIILLIIVLFVFGIGGIGWLFINILPKTFLFEIPALFWVLLTILISPIFFLIPKIYRIKSLHHQHQSQQNIQENIIREIQNNINDINQNRDKYIGQKVNLTQQHKENLEASKIWQQRFEKAQRKENELLASEALTNYQHYNDTAIQLKTKLDDLNIQINSIERELIIYERKLSKAEFELSQIQAIETHNKQNQLISRNKRNQSISGILRFILNFLAGRTKDIVLQKEQYVIDINEELAALNFELRKETENLINLQREYQKAKYKLDKWQQRYQFFIQIANEQEASNALSQQQYYNDIVLDWKTQIDEQTIKIETLNHNLSEKRHMFALAKAEKDIINLNKKYRN
ncbi:MAG: PspA/IM30 family protein [Cyanobacteria bacterium J06633_8]